MLGLKWSATTNMGSLALGAFIITLLKIARSLMEQAQNNNGGGAAAIVGLVLICLLSCIQAWVDYIDHIAIAFMAVSGDTFCTSAWNGFLINLKHMVKFYFAQEIGGFFIFMGVVFITAINTVIFWGIAHIGNTTNTSYVVPLIVIAVFSFFVCQITLGLFNDAIRATLMSFAVDMDLNKGIPQHGPPTFHEKLNEIFDDNFANNFNKVNE